jgi:hypothetical protein
LIYPKASARLEGYLYEAFGSELTRLPVAGRGLTARQAGDKVIFARQVDDEYQTALYNRTNEETLPMEQLLNVISDKCTAVPNLTSFICGAEFITFDENMPDNWYRGDTAFTDRLWHINTDNRMVTRLIVPEDETGRSLDVAHPQTTLGSDQLLFTNKGDQTLWSYTIPAGFLNPSEPTTATSTREAGNI